MKIATNHGPTKINFIQFLGEPYTLT